MSDQTTTAKGIATEIGCSPATVNSKAKALGIKIKGRSAEDHARLLDALKDVKPRPRKAKAKVAKKAPGRKAATKPAFGSDVDAYLKHGKTLLKDVRKQLAALDKEKASLEEKLNALLLMNPDSRK